MSAVTVELDGGLEDEPSTAPSAVEEAPAPVVEVADPGAAPGSILALIGQEIQEQVDESSKVLPVGKIRRLRARYRVLSDEEQTRIERQGQNAAKMRRKTGQDDDEIVRQNESCALFLATACVELLIVTEKGDEVPLRDVLAEPGQMGDAAPSGPLRYDRSTFELLMPERATELREQLGRDLTAVDVAMELHRWGDGYAPLRSYGRLLNLWMGGVSSEALADASQGN